MKTNLLAPSALCLLLLSTLTVMSNATIAPALPGLAREFAGTASAELLVKMLLPIPALFVVIFAPILGWTADKFGRRKQLLISTTVFALSGAAGAMLSGLEAILISRAILGICVAGLMTAITALITDYFAGQQRSQFMGLQQSFSNIGGIVFIVTAGYLANISARLPFYIYAAALLLVPLVFFAIKDVARTNDTSVIQTADNTQTKDTIKNNAALEMGAGRLRAGAVLSFDCVLYLADADTFFYGRYRYHRCQ